MAEEVFNEQGVSNYIKVPIRHSSAGARRRRDHASLRPVASSATVLRTWMNG